MTGAPQERSSSSDLADVDLTDVSLFDAGPPFALFDQMREQCPVAWRDAPPGRSAEAGPGHWHLTRAKDIAAVSKDIGTFSASRGGITMDPAEAGGLQQQRRSLIAMDPPQHTNPRTVVVRSFRPSLMRRLEDTIRSIVVARIEEVSQKDEFDFVEDFAQRITVDAITDLIGVPAEDRDQMFRWAQSIVVGNDPELAALYGTPEEGRQRSYEYMERLLEQRRAEPREDFASYLGSDEGLGGELSDPERIGLLRLLMEAGADTTMNTISFGVLAFSEHPDQWQRLLDDRSLVRQAVEEILRWAGVVAYFQRTATRDTEIAGQPIGEGDSVVMWFAAANRDPAEVSEPHVFDVTRTYCPHMAFGGGGVHQCPGATLARMELRIMLEELLARLPELHVTGNPVRMRSNLVQGLKKLPVRTRRE